MVQTYSQFFRLAFLSRAALASSAVVVVGIQAVIDDFARIDDSLGPLGSFIYASTCAPLKGDVAGSRMLDDCWQFTNGAVAWLQYLFAGRVNEI